MQVFLSVGFEPGFTHDEAVAAIRDYAKQKLDQTINGMTVSLMADDRSSLVAQAKTVEQLAKACTQLDEQIVRYAVATEKAKADWVEATV